MRIITDSSSEISQEEARALGIEVIPITILFGGEAYMEGIDLTRDEFYRRVFSREGEFPRTAQPSPQQYIDAFERTNGEETLVMLISSALSGMTETVRHFIRDGGYTNIRVYDTRCTSAVLRYLVLEAWRHRDKPIDEVIAILDEFRPRIKLLAAIDTLEYLCKGGRIKRATAVVGEMLGIKPIVTIAPDGNVAIKERVRGLKKAIKILIDSYLKDDVDHDYPVYFLQTNTDKYSRIVMEATNNTESPIFRICCAIGTHIGTDGAGLAWVSKQGK